MMYPSAFSGVCFWVVLLWASKQHEPLPRTRRAALTPKQHELVGHTRCECMCCFGRPSSTRLLSAHGVLLSAPKQHCAPWRRCAAWAVVSGIGAACDCAAVPWRGCAVLRAKAALCALCLGCSLRWILCLEGVQWYEWPPLWRA